MRYTKNQPLADLFYKEILKQQRLKLPVDQLLNAQLHLLELLFLEATRAEKLHFTTLFSRITYVCQKQQFPRKLTYALHNFRKNSRKALDSGQLPSPEMNALGLRLLADTTSHLFQTPIPAALSAALPELSIYPSPPGKMTSYKASCRVVVLEIWPEQQCLLAADEDRPGEEVRVRYGLAERNENFMPTIRLLGKVFSLPCTLQLLEVEIDEEGQYRPRGFILEPDHLVDVTAIAECFKPDGPFLPAYLMKKFLPFSASHYLMIGHIANFFLDELMHDPDQSFQDLFPRVFQLNPLAFALFDDSTVRQIYQQSKIHFLHIRQMVKKGFPENGIHPPDCFLEPSFFAPKYGLQGRLDVFYYQPDGQSAIVELKSGKTFRPNVYGLNNNHFTQTLLYDLIIRAVYGPKTAPLNYILYSGLEENQLRFAPVIKTQQMEALQVRNQILAVEKMLSELHDDSPAWPSVFRLLKTQKATGFVRRDLDRLLQVLDSQTATERAYFMAFTGFIAREHRLSKTGPEGFLSQGGQSTLWRNAHHEKEQRFEIISYLRVQEDRSHQFPPELVFSKTERTNPLANFRVGDIAVLYPSEGGILQHQVFKGVIVAIGKETVRIKLRARQFNRQLFENIPFWHLEHDHLDSSFQQMYEQLFRFSEAPLSKRNLWLTRRAPAAPDAEIHGPIPAELTEEQQRLFKAMVKARDYFLLWGPPGTGKTSIMLKNLAGYHWKHTDQNILLLAYTNRAVDEICAALEEYQSDIRQDYLRIGSSHSTAPRFRENLLQHKLATATTRKALKTLLANHRIFVSTLSSLLNRMDLLQLKSFDLLIIDEASQILEPMLMGLLPHFPKAVLIGDHQQLPAVVAQPTTDTKVNNEPLRQLGLWDLRDSLFERLYRRAQEMNWHWSFGKLSHQGRMHEAIVAFPSHFFYEDALHCLPSSLPPSARQKEPLDYQMPSPSNPWLQILAHHRVGFLPIRNSGYEQYKTNLAEARAVAQMAKAIFQLYAFNQLPFRANTLGIITPYRAQIAQIQKALKEEGLPLDEISVDTVERYQGSARDIILLSLCTNHLRQLESLISLSAEGVDRKLNVALTRARRHLFVFGNPDLLGQEPLYQAFIEKYQITTPQP